eukprot:TRINITY_DN17433_c0_g1_i1.p1 TRINITY_DN17433_c0_g1~~TRINITY_DN17433_c0_g1_i1.p1  ORF type:complete len:194 (-),score=50.67 TRINITY_DN17433_c0_g1_i1:83-664(-)
MKFHPWKVPKKRRKKNIAKILQLHFNLKLKPLNLILNLKESEDGLPHHLDKTNTPNMTPDYSSLAFYLVALITDCCLIFANVYFLALFSDLDSDQIHPTDLCKHLNVFIIPEMAVHAVLSVIILLKAPLLFLLNIPLLAWHGYRLQTKRFLMDATQIYRESEKETKILFAKLGFYMILFCFYLFYLIRATMGK